MTLEQIFADMTDRCIRVDVRLMRAGWRLHLTDFDGKQANREIPMADSAPDRIGAHILDLAKALPND